MANHESSNAADDAAEMQAQFRPEISHPGYLGNVSVVDGLVRQFVGEASQITTSEDLSRVITRYADIFAGFDPENHPQMQGWAERDKLGADLARYIGVSDMQPMVDILRTAFYWLYRECFKKALADANGDPEAAMPAVNTAITRLGTVLVGGGFALRDEREELLRKVMEK